METSKENSSAASEMIRQLADKPAFIRHEMDELVQRLAGSGDQELIRLGRSLESYGNITK